MANGDENKNNNAVKEQGNEDISGRTHNSNNPAFEKEDASNDISSIDQQEGNMNNGESGGNFVKGDSEA